eukprot:3940973-Rhodomonas_salina.5
METVERMMSSTELAVRMKTIPTNSSPSHCREIAIQTIRTVFRVSLGIDLNLNMSEPESRGPASS